MSLPPMASWPMGFVIVKPVVVMSMSPRNCALVQLCHLPGVLRVTYVICIVGVFQRVYQGYVRGVYVCLVVGVCQYIEGMSGDPMPVVGAYISLNIFRVASTEYHGAMMF